MIAVYDWIVFTSPEGVDLFFEELKKRRVDVRKLSHLKFAAIGSATKKAVEDRGILVEYTPSVYSTEFLAKGLVRKVHRKERVLIPRSVKGSKVLTDILSEHHISFDDVPLYERTDGENVSYKAFFWGSCNFYQCLYRKGIRGTVSDSILPNSGRYVLESRLPLRHADLGWKHLLRKRRQ